VLDEEGALDELYRRLTPVMDALDGPAEVILVDDGSTDRSYDIMVDLGRRDPRIRAVRLSRNFGHQMAITAGLDHARGNAVIIMDADLQDPPEIVLEMAKRWRDGFEVVYGVRDERAGESRAKVMTARRFYQVMNRLSEIEIPADAGDFRLVDRKIVDAVTAMREHSRYLRGMFAWAGYRQTAVHYQRAARHAGRTKFPFRKMFRFAGDAITSFSAIPLRMTLVLGFVVSLLSVLLGIVAVICKSTGVYVVPGWASIVVGMAFLGGAQLTVLGVTGQYIARIYEEVKQRPLYLVRDSVGFRRPIDPTSMDPVDASGNGRDWSPCPDAGGAAPGRSEHSDRSTISPGVDNG
jgi:glycosyltransferase involved in cell wall biosynthesis